MTYDPYRNELPRDPYRYDRDPSRSGPGAGFLLGAVLLAALGGFIYFFSSDAQDLATNEVRPQITQPSTTGSAPAPETTGSSANMPPASDQRMEQRLEPKVKPVE